MCVFVGFRYLVLLAMTLIFLYIVGKNVLRYRDGCIGETQKTMRAAEMYFPSLLLCPSFDANFSASRADDSKNLTAYFLKKTTIKEHVVSIKQQYVTEHGYII